MMDKQLQKNMYLKLKELYVNKKYSTFVKEATKYLEYFPKDSNVRFMRAKSYRKLNKFNEAIEDLNYTLKFGYDAYAMTELYFIYYYLNMYEEAIELLPTMYEKRPLNAYSVSISELIMKKQLGMEIKFKKDVKCDYIRSQIFNYSTSDALLHINKHLIETDENISYFNKDIDINYLFNLVRDSIKDSKKVNTEEILEIHYFGISNIGHYNNQICNFIKVVVIPNTDNIVSMYPTNNVDYNYVSNLEVDYDKLFKRDNKIKTMSRIDRFNKKYNIK